MPETLETLPIIDIDTHDTEPGDLWTSRAPASLRDRAPRLTTDDDGVQHWVVDEDTRLGPPGFCVVRRDGSKAHGLFSLPTIEEMAAASNDPKARVAEMDAMGVRAQILYPNTLGFGGNAIMRLEDKKLRDFCVSAYNDGIAELQANSGGRLYPQAVLPFWDADQAVNELVRCKEELGLTGFTMTDSPQEWDLPCLHETYWDPLWEAAQGMGLPVNFHIGSGAIGNPVWSGYDVPQQVATISVILFMNNMRCLTNLIFSGLLDRYPELKFVSVESGIGWIPFMLEACEYQMDENMGDENRTLELRPREYFRRQIYASFWFERENVPRTIELLGEDNVMFETDFPHPTCLYPDVRGGLQEALGKLDERVQRKVLHETASRVYGIPLP